MTTLSPCPCCGTAATFFTITDYEDKNFGGVGICCMNSLCGLTSGLMWSLMEDCRPTLAERWNRRTAQHPTSALDSGETFLHKKTGKRYGVLTHGSYEDTGKDAVIYRGEDGRIWVRPATEFYDGRFEKLDAAIAAKEKS